MTESKIVNEIISFCKEPSNYKNPVCKSLSVSEATQKPPLSNILNIIARYSSGINISDEEKDLAFEEFASITKFETPAIDNIFKQIKDDILTIVNINCFFMYFPMLLILIVVCVLNINNPWYIILSVFLLMVAIISLLWLVYYNAVKYYLKSKFNKFVKDAEQYILENKRKFINIIPGISSMSNKIINN